MGPLSNPSHFSRKLLPSISYRCVCGIEFKVDPKLGGSCPACQRSVSAEAIEFSTAATLSVSELGSQWPIGVPCAEKGENQWTGKELSHFRLEQCLGTGGMGSVYRALDKSLERYVAVKVLRSGGGIAHEPDRVEILLREAIAQARLNHPNVVTIYYVGRDGNEPFLAMELVSGGTLADRLAAGLPSYARIARWARQVVSALDHASQFGIVHGDIKPSNLLCHNEVDVKLSDFGLSRFDARQSVTSHALAGTPAYLAPELLEGGAPSIQSDMFALGVTLFELTFGHRPYNLTGQSIAAWVHSIRQSPREYPVTWPREVPREWARILDRLLAFDRADRYGDYNTLLADLQVLSPISSTSAGLAPRAMAYVLDQLMLLACLSPFALALLAMSQSIGLEHYQWTQPIVAATALIVPLLFMLWIRNGRKTIGRYLFQLRVVDEHGLALPTGDRLTREFLRNMLAWLFPLSLYGGLHFPVLDTIIDLGLIVFLSADIVCMLIRGDRRALHDLLCHSDVVLDNPSLE
jgi:uncharacterized RDD family membrane protein YckC